MHKLLLAAMLAVAPVALAQSQVAPAAAQGPQAEQVQQRIARRAAKLGEALGLDAAGVQRFQSAFENFVSQRRALHQQLRGVAQTLRTAAQGDATAQGQVDAALDQARSIRQQQAQLRDQLFADLSSGLAPQQKAKLALMLTHRHRFGQRGFGARGFGRWQRQGQGQPPPEAPPAQP